MEVVKYNIETAVITALEAKRQEALLPDKEKLIARCPDLDSFQLGNGFFLFNTNGKKIFHPTLRLS